MAENSFIRILKIYLIKLKAFFLSKDVLSFLFFLLLSTIFWFVNILGKERETTITVPVIYTNIPQNIAITNTLVENITLSVKDEGKKLLNYSSKKRSPLIIDLGRVFYEKSEIIISPDELSARISRYVLPTTTVMSINPDTLYIQYEKLASRTLPIQIDGEIEPAPQYFFSTPIRLEPGEVTVFAPERILDTLKNVKTERLNYKNIKDTISEKIRLQPIPSVKFASSETKISIYPEMFTEKAVQLPIVFLNCPKHLTIRTFPATVSVKFNVGITHFNEQNDIQIVLDYNEIDKKKNKQKPQVVTAASYISNVQISPEEVEFILEEK